MRSALVSLVLLASCSKANEKSPEVKAEPLPERPIEAVGTIDADLGETRPGPTPDDEAAVCEDDQELQSADRRFECQSDGDCTTSCQYGAINRRWFSVLGSECKDGCEGRLAGAPRCVDGRCAAFRRDGSPDEHCTNRQFDLDDACVAKGTPSKYD